MLFFERLFDGIEHEFGLGQGGGDLRGTYVLGGEVAVFTDDGYTGVEIIVQGLFGLFYILWVFFEVGEDAFDDIDDLKSELERLPERTKLSLIETRTLIEVDPEDVGEGIAQVLPVVVAALSPTSSLVMT